ncbi:MAG: cyclic nucleotide-binding domain-containing protein [Rhodospirillales bacterium]|nr:cyclic nucleotide-binding domain-containing protein [Rhodospirillales bacterium]
MKLVKAVTGVLHDHPIFQGLDDATEHFIADCASLSVFQAGDLIYKEQEAAEQFFIIRHGRVALEVHAPGQAGIVVDTLRPGDVLGWSWLIPPYRSNFDARALELTRAISFDARCLRGKMEQDPALGYEIYKRMMPLVASRLAASRRQLLDMYGDPEKRGVASWR